MPPTAAPSCSRWPRGCSPNAASAPPPCATSPTPPASCPAASTTTSTPRSRWSTRSCAASSTSCSGATARSWPRRLEPARDPGGPGRRLVRVHRPARHDAVAIYQSEAATWPIEPRFGYISERRVEFRELWLTLLDARASPTAASAPTSTSSWPTGSCATPCGSPCGWYRPGGALTVDAIAAAVPVHRARRHRRRAAPAERRESCHGRGLHRRRGPHAGRRRGGGAVRGAPGRPRRARHHRAVRAQPRCRPGAVDDVDLRLRRHLGPQAGDIARTAGWPPATR